MCSPWRAWIALFTSATVASAPSWSVWVLSAAEHTRLCSMHSISCLIDSAELAHIPFEQCDTLRALCMGSMTKLGSAGSQPSATESGWRTCPHEELHDVWMSLSNGVTGAVLRTVSRAKARRLTSRLVILACPKTARGPFL